MFFFLGKSTRIWFFVSVFVGLLWVVVELFFLPILQGFLTALGLIDRGQTNLPEWFPLDFNSTAVLLCLFAGFRAALIFFKNWVAYKAQLEFLTDMRGRVIRVLFDNRPVHKSSELIALFTESMSQASSSVQSASLAMGSLVCVVSFSLTALYLAPIEMLMGVIVLAILILPTRWGHRLAFSFGDKIALEWETTSHLVFGAIKNHFFLRISNYLEHTQRESLKSIERYRALFMKHIEITSFLLAYPMFVGFVLLCVVSKVSVDYMGTKPITVLSFFYIFVRMLQNVSELNSNYGTYRGKLPGFLRLTEFLTAESRQFCVPGNEIQVKVESHLSQITHIQAESVSLKFDENEVFRDLNFSMKSGDFVLIKGKSGAGKSSLLSLIVGLISPTSGRIILNRKEEDRVHYDLRARVAYVGPEPFMIYGTILDNLMYCNQSKPQLHKIESLIRELDLHEKVQSLPLGLNTILGDDLNFSTGQRARLAIIRALLRPDADILVFDEATANLDPALEMKVGELLRRDFSDRILIATSHRSLLDSMATKILDLDPVKT